MQNNLRGQEDMGVGGTGQGWGLLFFNILADLCVEIPARKGPKVVATRSGTVCAPERKADFSLLHLVPFQCSPSMQVLFTTEINA